MRGTADSRLQRLLAPSAGGELPECSPPRVSSIASPVSPVLPIHLVALCPEVFGRRAPPRPKHGPALHEDDRAVLARHLPQALRHHAWHLAYSTDRDGWSVQEICRRTYSLGPNVLAVRTCDGELLGAFSTVGYAPNPGFLGNGECFLWRIGPSGRAEVFRWSGLNRFFVHVSKSRSAVFNDGLTWGGSLHFGGGGAGPGLQLADALNSVESAESETFQNPQMLHCGRSAEVACVEVWGLRLSTEVDPEPRLLSGLLTEAANAAGRLRP
eukprot:TRINITY_DN20634_c0_g1_i1.p1 TRINITY_DN20634_c0_g1~~TRINITY_DN20634_c0_g1_i1.p1  ORF type:complete len:296 (+),score=60.30 TRINITY_DN20634_c0_g1_i1:83-889(+)